MSVSFSLPINFFIYVIIIVGLLLSTFAVFPAEGTKRDFSTAILERKKATNRLVVDEALNDDNSVVSLMSMMEMVYDDDLLTKDAKIGEADIDIKTYVEGVEKDEDAQRRSAGRWRRDCYRSSKCRELSSQRKLKLVQEMCLVLKNVECGSVEIEIEWTHF